MPPAARFFDDPRYLRTVVAEKPGARSAAEARDAARLAGCRPGALVLDAGCGNGRHALPLARAGHRVVALDRSPRLLAAARREAGGAAWPQFVHGSYAQLPFAGDSFGAVLSLGTSLGYLGDGGEHTVLREFRRVLPRGGRLVIETLHRAEIGSRLVEHEERRLPGGGTLCIDRRFDRARGLLHETQRLDDGTPEGSVRAYDLRVYGEDELCQMLGGAGFAVVGRHGSLAGEGEPKASTPLVLVAEANGRGRPRDSAPRE
jgi:SAM-dependent methyltransferase